jgi:hypothetical protein
MDLIFQTATDLAKTCDVLFEGLLISIEVNRTNKIAETHNYHIVALTTSLNDCVASINARRAAKGNTEPVNPDNTASKHRGILGTFKRLSPRVKLVERSRVEAFEHVKQLLDL